MTSEKSSEKLLAQLKEQIMIVPYNELEPHLKRASVIMLDETLDMAQVGLALANDDKAQVEDLISRDLLNKASPLDFESWRREKRFFSILIIQPFVLAQNFTALSPTPN